MLLYFLFLIYPHLNLLLMLLMLMLLVHCVGLVFLLLCLHQSGDPIYGALESDDADGCILACIEEPHQGSRREAADINPVKGEEDVANLDGRGDCGSEGSSNGRNDWSLSGGLKANIQVTWGN